MKTLKTPIAELSFDETESIIHIKVSENAEMNLENAKIHYKKINELVGDKKYLALVDASNYYTIQKEAWQYASSKDIVANRIAVAHYQSNLANTLTTNTFKSVYKTYMPVEIFETKQKALDWLKSFINN